MKTSLNATVIALMARGVDSKLAETLAEKKYTLTALKQMSEKELVALGLKKWVVNVIHSEKRPPIPTETLNRVLYDANYTCCICKKHPRPIIIHHIREWHDSRDHDEPNLVVLCHLCHDEAHTNHKLSVNLTPERLLDCKRRWLKDAKAAKLKKRLTAETTFEIAVWDYFNLKRLLPSAISRNVSLKSCKRYANLRDQGILTEGGDLVVNSHSKGGRKFNYQYEAINSFNYIGLFYDSVLRKLLKKIPVIDLSEMWNRSTVNTLKSGSVVIYAGGWKFKKKKRNGPATGPGQFRTAYVQKHGIRLEFDFDAWEAMSGSSWGNLAGSRSATGICIVRSVERRGKQLFIHATALAIGTGFPIPQSDSRYGGVTIDPDEEDLVW